MMLTRLEARSADSSSMMLFVDFHPLLFIFVDFLISIDFRLSGPPVPMGLACLSASS